MIPKKPKQEALLTGLLAVLILAGIYFTAKSKGVVLDFFPIDGDLQSYNPVHRIIEGQAPGHDFKLYLGWGMTMIIRLAAKIFSENYAGIKSAAYFCNAIGYTMLPLAAMLAVGVRARWAVFLAGMTFFISSSQLVQEAIENASRHPLLMVYSLIINVEPGVSARSLRASGAAWAALLLLAFYATLRLRQSTITNYLWAVACGLTGGFFFLWSSDFGPPTAVMCLIAGAAIIVKEGGDAALYAKISQLVLMCLAAGSCVIITAALIGGRWWAILDWYSYWADISAHSFWYYDTRLHKVVNLSDIKISAITPVTIGIALYAAYQYYSKSRFNYLVCFLFLGLNLAVGYLLFVINNALTSYFHPVYIVTISAAAGFVLLWLIKCLKRGQERMGLLNGVGVVLSLLICALFVTSRAAAFNDFIANAKRRSLIDYGGGSILDVPRNDKERDRAIKWDRLIFVQELGGYLSSAFAADIAQARADDQYAKSQNGWVYSTYGGFFEAIGGKLSKSPVDYLIHTISPKISQSIVDQIRANPPSVIRTINPEYSAYEKWVRSQHWELYRLLFSNYEVAAVTPLYLIWHLRETSQVKNQKWSQCQVERLSPSEVQLLCPVPNEGSVNMEGMFGEIEIEYDAKSNWPQRPYLYCDEDSVRAETGLQPGHVKRVLPVSVEAKSPPLLRLKLEPTGSSNLEILSARYRRVENPH